MPKLSKLTNDKRSLIKKVLSNFKLTNVGRKMEIHSGCPVESSSKERISYPELYLNAEQLPDLAKKEVGDEIIMVVRGKVSSHSLNENMVGDGQKKRERFEIEISEIGIVDKKKK